MQWLIFWFNRLSRAHAEDRLRGIWFKEEARAERSANLIRITYILVWILSTSLHIPTNNFGTNVVNVGGGFVWLLIACLYQIYLYYNPYKPAFKYLSTTCDMCVITAMLFFYQFSFGYSFALKTPTFYSYFCCLGLAALRYKRGLAVYGGLLASTLYALLVLYLYRFAGMEFGTNIEHVTTPKVCFLYIAYNVVYLFIFSMLTYILIFNVKRLVIIRVKESETALKAKERALIAANVAHEIKNPLEGIYGAAQLLKEEQLGNPKFIDMILKDARRLNGVVHQFLQFSRPFKTEMQDFDIIRFTSQFCEEQNELGEVKLVSNLPEGKLMACADPTGVEQILLNLSQNAKRYQQMGMPIQIKADQEAGYIQIAVEDDGEGVAPENYEKIFDPFFTTSNKGTGLGLAISRKIAQEMGGDLIYTPKNPGSRFTLLLKTVTGESHVN